MPASFPEKLRKPPLLECVFEVRFSPSTPSAGELLLGLLYSQLNEFKKVDALPVSTVPTDKREADPNLRYLPTRQLTSKNQKISVGDRVASFAQSEPYEGWGVYKSSVIRFLGALKGMQLIERTERYSIKFINLLATKKENPLSILNATFEIGGRPASHQGFHCRTEFVSNDFIDIVEVLSGTAVSPTGEARTGIILAVDVIRMTNVDDIWTAPERRRDEIHDVLKAQFFQTLKPETISEFEPIYGEK